MLLNINLNRIEYHLYYDCMVCCVKHYGISTLLMLVMFFLFIQLFNYQLTEAVHKLLLHSIPSNTHVCVV